jgi:hypothetical protein
VLETQAENTKKVMAWHNKQKETAQKQDISEDLQKFLGPKLQRAKTQPSQTLLGILSVSSGRTSKMEFVCKSYGQLKFAIENCQKLTKLSNSD